MTEPAERDDQLNPFTWKSDIQAAIDADAAAEWDAVQAREHAARAHQAGLEAVALAEATAVADAAAAEVSAMEPPALPAAVTNGMLPMRARLLAYTRWIADLETELERLTAGRAAWLEKQGVPALTKAKIAALIKSDTDGIISLMSQNGAPSDLQLRSHERKLLSEKLSRDQHAAETADAAIQAVDIKLSELTVQIAILKNRHAEFCADVIQEHLLLTAAADQNRQVDVLRETEIKVLGGYAAVQSLRGLVSEPRHQRIALPSIRMAGESWVTGNDERPGHHVGGLLSGHSVELPVHEQLAERKRWLDRAAALRADPLAELENQADGQNTAHEWHGYERRIFGDGFRYRRSGHGDAADR